MFKILLYAIQIQRLSIKRNLCCRHQLFILAAQLRLLLHQWDICLAKCLFIKFFSRKKLLSVLILFPDLLIAALRVHKRLNIHLLKLPLTAKKRQQITAAKADRRHQHSPAVRRNRKPILHLHHGKHDRHQYLLQ